MKTETIRTITAAALAGAVGLGASASAQAQQVLMIDSATSVAYAKETLRLDETQGAVGDATQYYKIGNRTHTVVGPAQVRKTGQHDAESYTVLFELTGMVFSTGPSGYSVPTLVRSDGTGTDHGTASYSIYAGGGLGDKYVVFQVADSTETATPTDVLTLTAAFAVSTGGGGIKRTITNANLKDAGLPEAVWKRVHEVSSAITVKSALKETVTPTDAQAKAAHNFMAFGGTAVSPVRTASLGSVMLGVVTPNLRNAQGADDDVAPTGSNTISEQMGGDGMWEEVRSLSDIIPAKTTPVSNPVMFSGDVSFASKVALRDSATCSGIADATDLRVPSTDTLKATDANDFTSAMHLCLMVDGETAILPGSYSVKTQYAAKSSSHAFAAPGGTHALGTITRDGTTAHIPFITTYEGYNQRLLLRNRGGRDATYTVTFVTEDGTVATPSSVAGTVPAMSVKMMRVRDLVTLSGASNRAAATVTSNAAFGKLGIATTLVNIEDRSTDTETYVQ